MRRFAPILTLLILAAAALFWPISVPKVPPHSTLVVLGAAQYAGRPSPAFKTRLDQALKLYRGGGIRCIVVTGGRQAGDPYTEGEVGVNYLASKGVPPSNLLAETRSRTTWQNLSFAQELLPPGTAITVVTDQAHAPRALALAHKLGFEATASPSPLRDKVDPRYLLRERLALAAFYLLGRTG